jgi:hypothetical protein
MIQVTHAIATINQPLRARATHFIERGEGGFEERGGGEFRVEVRLDGA